MTVSTVAINRRMRDFNDRDSFWLFGYGSLLFKAGFPYLECRPATISGWSRRFWQGSHDHRGTAGAPGRVVTLIEDPGVQCTGMAFRITPEVLEPLDVREQNGYLRFTAELSFHNGGADRGLVYIATADNPAFLGPAPISEMACQIASAAGPSGPNREYLLGMARALRELRVDDPHVSTLEEALFVRERSLDARGPGESALNALERKLAGAAWCSRSDGQVSSGHISDGH